MMIMFSQNLETLNINYEQMVFGLVLIIYGIFPYFKRRQ